VALVPRCGAAHKLAAQQSAAAVVSLFVVVVVVVVVVGASITQFKFKCAPL